MGYEGEVLRAMRAYDFSAATIVVVSGDKLNPCGHAFLHLQDADGTPGGWYFQVARLYDYPRYMSGRGYERYRRENGKTELYRRSYTVPDPDGANRTLEALMAQKWFWGGAVHNCGTFIEAVIKGGGGSVYSIINCPILTPWAQSIPPILPPRRMGP